ncbi:Threonine aldolase [Mortierella claussenii]|nr:Threonine aldolase [Mortierella claussenii]
MKTSQVNPLPYSDFRSDTATAPTPDMFAAMMQSSLGDDVYNEDDSVKKLERYVATLTGHEAALFCSSGTMTNQLAHRVHLCNPPQSAMVDIRSHVFNYEAGGISFHSQAAVYPIMPANGRYLTVEDIASRLVLDVDVHYAPTRVISLENTLNGTIMPIEEIARIRELTEQHGVKLHLDGARLWHASIATGISMKKYCSYFDTISLCLSKGIGAPIGSILVGSEMSIKKARHFRLLFGGGWRQAGILAEAALWGIKTNWPTMKDTHRRAKTLEDAFVRVGCQITNPVDTNMVWVDTTNAGFTVEQLMADLAKEDIKISGNGYAARVVLHYQISDEAVDRFIAVLHKLANKTRVGLVHMANPDEMLEEVGEDDQDASMPSPSNSLAMPATPTTPTVGHHVARSLSGTTKASFRDGVEGEEDVHKQYLFDEGCEEANENDEILQPNNRKTRRAFSGLSHQRFIAAYEHEVTKQAKVSNDSNEFSESAMKKNQRQHRLLLEPEQYDNEGDTTMVMMRNTKATPRKATQSMNLNDMEAGSRNVNNGAVSGMHRQSISEEAPTMDKIKKLNKLQYRISHNPASKTLKRASHRLARWSGSFLTRET